MTFMYELNKGEHFMATLAPSVELKLDATTLGASYFDSYEWLANIRAWSKWWLNPWAWWNPSAYSLDENDLVEWDGNPPIISRSQE